MPSQVEGRPESSSEEEESDADPDAAAAMAVTAAADGAAVVVSGDAVPGRGRAREPDGGVQNQFFLAS